MHLQTGCGGLWVEFVTTSITLVVPHQRETAWSAMRDGSGKNAADFFSCDSVLPEVNTEAIIRSYRGSVSR